MAAEVEPIPGARQALLATTALGLPFRIASNSSHEEMAAKFARTGLADLVDGRIHSAYDLIARGKRGKPDPDLFLEAAAAEGVPPAACVVVEDLLAGVRAAISAGMTCLGFSPDNDGAHLAAAGALPFAVDGRATRPAPRLPGPRAMTITALASFYLWIKSFHVISLIAWMAGIFYLPRLYVYHTRPGPRQRRERALQGDGAAAYERDHEPGDDRHMGVRLDAGADTGRHRPGPSRGGT